MWALARGGVAPHAILFATVGVGALWACGYAGFYFIGVLRMGRPRLYIPSTSLNLARYVCASRWLDP